jgi:hypothetical protein
MTTPSSTMTRQRALERCNATGRHEHTSGLYGHCATCGEIAHDWRQLLGVGARFNASTTDAQSARLTYPGACGCCGGSELVIGPR